MILQSGLMDRNLQVEFSLKVSLKSLDVDIYGNVRQIFLSKMVSEVWFFFCLKHHQFLASCTVEKRPILGKDSYFCDSTGIFKNWWAVFNAHKAFLMANCHICAQTGIFVYRHFCGAKDIFVWAQVIHVLKDMFGIDRTKIFEHSHIT